VSDVNSFFVIRDEFPHPPFAFMPMSGTSRAMSWWRGRSLRFKDASRRRCRSPSAILEPAGPPALDILAAGTRKQPSQPNQETWPRDAAAPSFRDDSRRNSERRPVVRKISPHLVPFFVSGGMIRGDHHVGVTDSSVHGFPAFSIALAITTSFRITAISASRLSFPASTRRW
jgi:hypothetical protein